MTDRSVEHASFAVERHYPATPERVFAAWTDPAAKRRWFAAEEGWTQEAYLLDVRVGGRERAAAVSPEGHAYLFEAVYLAVVRGERLVFASHLDCDDQRMSVSLSTVELAADGGGTALTYTEQAAFLDGLDRPHHRESGTRHHLERLAIELGGPAA